MQEQPIEGVGVLSPDVVERAVLALLLDRGSPGVWSVGELAQALGSEVCAADALTGLHMAGLVHRWGELVCASRAAVRCWAVATV
jgi:hypothetical protein